MKRVTAQLVGLAILVVVVVIAFLAATLERVEEQVDTPPDSLVAVNPYYALQKLIGSMGLEADSVYGTGMLPPPGGALVVIAEGRDRSPDELLEWVEGGGHLVLTPVTSDDEDPWLDAIGVSFDKGTGVAEPVAVVDSQGTRAVLSLDPARTVRAENAAWTAWVVDAGPDATAAGPIAVAFPRGAGWITVLGSGVFLDNDHLADGDDAPWFWDVLTRPRVPESVVLVIRSDAPGIARLIWRHARPALLSISVLTVAWLHTRSRRFGPVLPEPQLARRSVLEHTAAMGRFLWYHGQGDVLAADVRDAVLRRLVGRIPDCATFADAQWLEAVARATGTEVGVVRVALSDPDGAVAPAAFVRRIDALTLLWKS